MVAFYCIVGLIVILSIITNVHSFHKDYGLGIFQSCLIGLLSIPAIILSLVQKSVSGLEHIALSIALILGGVDREELQTRLMANQLKKLIEQTKGDRYPFEDNLDDKNKDQ